MVDETKWMEQAIAGQQAVGRAIAASIECEFYSLMAKYQARGHSPGVAAQLAVAEMNGASDSGTGDP